MQPGRGEIDDTEADDDADLLTRTMAELYARQGLIDEAEAIYRELMRDRPDDDGLRDGLDAVLGMRAARGASRTPDVPPEAPEVEAEDIVEAESAAESAGPETVPAADALAELLRAGEALVHRLPEPPAQPAARTDDSDPAGADSVEPESVDEPPDVRPVLEEWLRRLRS
jgi:pentatricopeptide repeat protein